MRCAIYARVSTCEQEPENQLQELRRYAEARGWTTSEYIDKGVSGAKDRRPVSRPPGCGCEAAAIRRPGRLAAGSSRAQSEAPRDAAGRRAGRRHRVRVSWAKASTARRAAGRLQLHVLAALAEFERARIAERVRAGLARVRASGKRLGRPAANLALADVVRTAHLSVREAAGVLGVSRSVAASGTRVPETCGMRLLISSEIGDCMATDRVPQSSVSGTLRRPLRPSRTCFLPRHRRRDTSTTSSASKFSILDPPNSKIEAPDVQPPTWPDDTSKTAPFETVRISPPECDFIDGESFRAC